MATWTVACVAVLVLFVVVARILRRRAGPALPPPASPADVCAAHGVPDAESRMHRSAESVVAKARGLGIATAVPHPDTSDTGRMRAIETKVKKIGEATARI